MKNKLLIIISIVLAVFILKTNFLPDRVEDVEYVFEQREQVEYDVYYYDDEKLVKLNVSLDTEEVVSTLFDLISNKSNSIKEDYDTKIITSTKLIDYTIEDTTLTLNLDSEFLRYKEEDGFKIINQLKNTFSNLGYTKLVLNVEDVLLENISNITIYDGIELYNI